MVFWVADSREKKKGKKNGERKKGRRKGGRERKERTQEGKTHTILLRIFMGCLIDCPEVNFIINI